MQKRTIHIIFIILLFFGKAISQISPGDLANVHKHLEGMTNCTLCHDLGNKVTNDKCLNCHKEIKTRISRNKGYHVSKDVKGKECATCHSDHNGRNFDMVRFNEKKFNHVLAGYELTGGHIKIDCRQCHKPDYIEDPMLKKRKETYLGLKQECLSCHKDRHQKTLGNDCTKCHSTEAFKPAGKFNHDKTSYALLAKHKTVQCIECHKKEIRNGAEFQVFSGIEFKNCNNCHQDPHRNNLGQNCKECHNEQSFTALAPLTKFNHNKTQFQLKGKHNKVSCKECHKIEANPLSVFQDRKNVLIDNCIACHKDIHEGKFGSKCIDCHNETGFKKQINIGSFDHNLTKYPLIAKHLVVDCKKCHITEKMTDPLPHENCAACHKDYHENQFKKAGINPDCANCHTVDGFSASLFSIEEHAKTKFPLEGGHIATPCFACHKQESKWKFKDLGERCNDCHIDIHLGQIDKKWYPNQSCDQCHLPTSWTDNKFDHSKTAFKLEGSHSKQNCRECHKPEGEYKYGKFAGTSTNCISCHENIHQTQFEIMGITECTRCHNFESWTIKNFNHNKTRFKLDGKHINVKCILCHKEVIQNDKKFIQYKMLSFECKDCHK